MIFFDRLKHITCLAQTVNVTTYNKKKNYPGSCNLVDKIRKIVNCKKDIR